MNFLQSLNRFRQQLTGWSNSFNEQEVQFSLIKKLYAKNGLEIIMTCEACPEQYEIFKNGKQIAYYRLRHGEFSVSCQDNEGEEIIMSEEPNGDGMFDPNERLNYLTKAMRKVLLRLEK